MSPRVSVVMSVYNGLPHLGMAIHMVRDWWARMERLEA